MSDAKIEITVVIRDGRGKEKSYSFAKSRILIGRTVSCDVPLQESSAGKEHARLEVSGEGAVRLVDLGTSTGTLLNGNQIQDSILVNHGDELRVGDTSLLVKIKRLQEGLAATRDRTTAGRWKSYELPNKPVLNIAQLWEDSVIGVQRFGKSAKFIIHAVVFTGLVLSLEFWFLANYYTSLRALYMAGKLADYGPQLSAVIGCFVIADIIVFIMARDLFRWPRYYQFKSVRIGQSKRADFFVPTELLGEKLYNLVVQYKGKPALNLANPKVGGRVLVDGQVLPVAEIKKTSYIKEKHYLPLNYKTRGRIEIGHVTFILGLDPALREPKGAFLSSINVPVLASFGLAFFLNALFMLALMAAPRTEPVIRVASSQSRSFKTLIKAEKKKKEEEKKKKVDIKKEEKKKEVEKKKDEEELKDEVEKAPVLEEKVIKEERRVVKKTIKIEKKKSLVSDLKTKTKKKKRLSSATMPVSKDKVRKTGALAALDNAGMKVMGSNWGAGDLSVDSSFAPVGDLAIAGLGEGGDGLDLGGAADSDPFDLSSVDGAGTSLDGEAGPGAGGFSGTVGADGAALSGKDLIAGSDFDDLRKKKISSSVKNPKFKERSVKITPSAKFGMEGSGKLDRSVVKKYIRKQLAKIRWCYQKAFQKNPELEGKLTVSFIISPTGSVMSAKVVKSTLGDKDLEGCIEKKILTWRFPAPQGGGVVKVNYPFVLRKQ
jgi:outer membrane biosynthesis protein TonB